MTNLEEPLSDANIRTQLDLCIKAWAAKKAAKQNLKTAESHLQSACSVVEQVESATIFILDLNTREGHGAIKYQGHFWQLSNGRIVRIKAGDVRDLETT